MALPNFLKLYSQLDLQPECSLDDFKYAYRRRIAELHPDRSEAMQGKEVDEGTLSDLNLTYAAAIRFHKQHGRFPGSKLESPRRVAVELTQRTVSAPEAVNAKPRNQSAPGLTYHEKLAVLMALALALLSLYLVLEYL